MTKTLRFHHIDALRGSVMLLLVPYHGLKYLQLNEGGFSGSAFLIHWLHLWRMPLFFAVSGFLAAMTLARWGVRRQLKSRLKRIGIPLAVGMVTIVPLVALVMIGLSHLFHGDSVRGPRPFALGSIFRTQPMHLWFLNYLLIMSVLAVAAVLVLRRLPQIRNGLDRLFRIVVGSPFMVPALGLASGSALYLGGFWRAPAVVAQSLVPNPEAFAFYTVFFVFGWLLYRNIGLLPKIESGPGWKLLLGTAFAVLGYYLYSRRTQTLDPASFRVPVLIAGAMATWLTLFGFWGLFARLFARERFWLRYLADASYWIFLIHVPFLSLASVSLAQTELPIVLRLMLAVAFSIGASLATYALFVRHTAIGRLLNGPRPKRRELREAAARKEALAGRSAPVVPRPGPVAPETGVPGSPRIESEPSLDFVPLAESELRQDGREAPTDEIPALPTGV